MASASQLLLLKSSVATWHHLMRTYPRDALSTIGADVERDRVVWDGTSAAAISSGAPVRQPASGVPLFAPHPKQRRGVGV